MIFGNIIAETVWERARLGRFTASGIHRLLTPPKSKEAKESGQLSETAKGYLFEKASEILTGTTRQIQTFSTDWGNTYEPEAVALLAPQFIALEYYGNENKRFFSYSKFAGGSPDAISGKNVVFEIKCPENPANHVEYFLLTEKTFSDYRDFYAQLQMNMLSVAVCYKQPFLSMRGFFVSYYPMILDTIPAHCKLKVLEIRPNKDFKEKLDIVLPKAEKLLSEMMLEIITPPQK